MLQEELDTQVLSSMGKNSLNKANENDDSLSYLQDIKELLSDIENSIKNIDDLAQKQEVLCRTLNEKFPNVKRFEDAIKEAEDLKNNTKKVITCSQKAQDKLLATLDLTKEQTAQNEKYKHVIDSLHSLSAKMTSMLEGN